MTSQTDGFFVLEGVFDHVAFARAIEPMGLQIKTSTTPKPFVFLDCHDQSLRASEKLLIETGGTLNLLQGDGQLRVQKTKGIGWFPRDLPDGPVRDGLAGFPKLRALMAIGSGDVSTQSLTVLDDLQKTQVRGTILSMSSASGTVALVRVQQLRGYDRAFETVCTALKRMALPDGGVAAVFQGLFPNMKSYQAKPDIKLGKTEPSIQVATDIIRTYLGVARQNEDGILADTDTEFLHDYRVSLRRVRSVLSLFKGVFAAEQTAEFKQVFSGLMEPTGRLRDLDVYLLEKDMYFNLVPPNLHPGLHSMFERFEKERAQELTRLSRRLRSSAYNTSMTELAAVFESPDAIHAGPNGNRGAYEYAGALIWKRYRKVCKLARSISEDTEDETVHDLRIDCKKLRYLMEFFAPLFDAKSFKTIIKPLKKLQDNLGLFNDYSVQQEALLSFVSQHSNAQGRVDARIGMAAGGLIAVLDQRQRAERDRVIANFQQFDGPDIRHLFRSLFHRTGE